MTERRELEPCETAWLIEMQEKGGISYWGRADDEDGVVGWTPDVEKAIRYCRQQDAQAVIDDHGWTWIVAVEHQWGPTSTPPTGYVMVPVEPTDEIMEAIEAGCENWSELFNSEDGCRQLYAAMLDAASAKGE